MQNFVVAQWLEFENKEWDFNQILSQDIVTFTETLLMFGWVGGRCGYHKEVRCALCLPFINMNPYDTEWV